MSIALEPATGLTPDDSALGTDRTVPRSLVHREALGEVFLTDLQGDSARCFRAAAQLPRSHAYWGDHLLRPAGHDPVLLIEACRQAALAGSHRFHAVPREAKFILTHQQLHLDRPDLLTIGDKPTDLTMHLTATDRKEREGQVTGVDYTVELEVESVRVGTARVGLRFRAPAYYQELRVRCRGGSMPGSSANLPSRVPGNLPAPYLVGRNDPANVVLLDAMPLPDGASATLKVPGDHPSLFDHPQDHIPGMVLVEAGRQLALYAAHEQHGLAPGKARLIAAQAHYHKFGELDRPVRLDACISDPSVSGHSGGVTWTQAGPLDPWFGTPDTPGASRELKIEVTSYQDGDPICDLTFAVNVACA